MGHRPHVYTTVRKPARAGVKSTRRHPLGITAEVRCAWPHDADVNEVLEAISDASEQAVLDFLKWKDEHADGA